MPVCSDTMEGLPKIRPSVTKVGIGSSREAQTTQAALLHQGFDLRALQPLAVENVGRIVRRQGVDGVLHPLSAALPTKRKAAFSRTAAGSRRMALQKMSCPLRVLQRAYRDKEGPPAGKADVVAGESSRLHSPADRRSAARWRNAAGPSAWRRWRGSRPRRGARWAPAPWGSVGDEGVARKGIVQPPQHRHKGAVQGAHGGGFHHRVGQHKVCAGGQPPQGGEVTQSRRVTTAAPASRKSGSEPSSEGPRTTTS